MQSKSPQGIQAIVNESCNTYHMEIHESKTKGSHFRPKCVNRTTYKFTSGNLDIEIATTYKYLGLQFSEDMDESETVNGVAKRASSFRGYNK